MEITAPPGLTARVLTLPGAPEELMAGWQQALARGFQSRRPSPDFAEHVRAGFVADGTRLVGLWDDDARLADPAIPVATFGEWTGSINTGGPDGPVPLHMISEVTVAASHRRRGLLRAMLEWSLRDAAERGLPLAGLTVSEGSIYGRFGFGVATSVRHVEVDTSSRFTLRDTAEPAGAGTVEMVEPPRLWPVVEQVFDAFHARNRGSVSRPAMDRAVLSGAIDPREQGEDHRLRGAAYLDATGRPDGYVLYRHLSEREEGRRVMEVVDLAGSATAYVGLWRFLAGIDLVERVRWHQAPPQDDPLPWAVTDPRVVRTTGTQDLLWLRVLDVPAALEHRRWAAAGTVVLAVEDPQRLTSGRYRIEASAGSAEVTVLDPESEESDLRVDVEALGSLHLGGTTSATLARAGRLAGPDDVVARWCAMSDHAGPAAYGITHF